MFSSKSYLTFIIHKFFALLLLINCIYHKYEFQTIRYFKKSIDRERIEVSFLCLAIPSCNKIFYWKSNEIVSYVCTISWNFRRLNEHVNRGGMGIGVKYSAQFGLWKTISGSLMNRDCSIFSLNMIEVMLSACSSDFR